MFEQDDKIETSRSAAPEQNGMDLLSLTESKGSSALSGTEATSNQQTAKLAPLEIVDNAANATKGAEHHFTSTTNNPGDHGAWVGSDTLRGPHYQPSQSEQNGYQAAQLLMNPNATAADRLRAQQLILNSPNPDRAVYTANNGYPVTQGFLGFGGTNTDSLSAHQMSISLTHTQVHHPAVGGPNQLLHRPAWTENVPSGISLRLPPMPPPREYPRIHAR